MLQVYTGQGKGKTTSSLGLALRAIGSGKKVLLIQFLKDGQSSEIKAIRKYLPNFKVKSYGRSVFLTKTKLLKKDYQLADQGINLAKDALKSGEYDLVILDEINIAVDFGLVSKNELLKLLKAVPKKIEIILTGRGAKKEIIEKADLVTEMKEVKHYFKESIKARKGIEY